MEDREVAIGLMASAQERLEQGELTVAAKLAERARDLFASAQELKSACGAALAAGHARMRGGDLASAREAFEWARAEATAHGLKQQQLAATTDLGALMEVGGDLEAALAMHQHVLRQAREDSDPMALANAAGNVGRLLTRLFRYDEAESLLQESLVGFDALDNDAGRANAHICLGDLRRADGKNAEAEAHFEQAAALSDPQRLTPLRAMALLNLGHLRRERGELAPALEAFAESAALAEGIGDLQGLARARMAEGMTLADRAEPKEALERFEKAEAAFVEMGQPGAALAASVNKAAVQCRLGKLAEGHALLESARTVLTHIGDLRAVQEVTFALCEVALGMGDAAQAEALLEETRQAEREVGEHGDTFGPRLQLRARLVESRLAMRSLLFEQTGTAAQLPAELEATPSDRFAVEMMQAELAVLSGDPAAAQRVDDVEALAEATATPRELGAARSLRGQQQLWSGDLVEARATYLRARALWRELHEPIPEMQAQAALWWIDLLSGHRPALGEVRMVEREARDVGVVDTADALACLARTAEVLAARQRSPDVTPETDHVLSAVEPLLRRGNRLSAAVVVALAAGVTGSPSLRDHAATLAGHSRLTPPQVGAWRRA